MTKSSARTEVEVVDKQNHAVVAAGLSFEEDAGAGMEGATQESFAIPFLMVLQKGSPQVDEALGTHIEGAKAGMFFDNVTGRMFEGKKGVTIIPCAYKRVFIRWGGRDGGDPGFKGELSPEVVAEMRSKNEIVELDGHLLIPGADGSVNEKKSDRVNDTRNHYVLLVDEETGAWSQALISLSSTQIKKSKMLMSAIASVKVQGSNGMYTPPAFANFVRATTIPEQNDKGSWYGVRFELAGRVDRQELYNAAKEFHAIAVKGGVEVKYEGADGAETSGAGDKF